MDYHNLVVDFAKRTRKNLEFIRSAQVANPELEVFEVTQLVNSLLGLLVFPQQRFMDQIEPKPLEEIEKEGWPVPQVEGNYPQVRDLKQLIGYLRNSIAHCNVHFIPDESGRLVGLTLWNKRRGKTTWRATMSIEDLEGICERFTDLIIEERPRRRRAF